MSMNRRFTSHSPSSEGPERDTLPDAARVTPRADVTRPGDAWVYPGVGPSDAVLVRRVREGDTAAYAVLVARYRNRLGRYATHMLGDREDAEEAVQDAFVRGYRSLARCDDDERFGPWLFGILVNRCRTAGRRAARRQRLFVRDDASLASAEAPSSSDEAELDALVRRALDRLPVAQREAFLLKFVEDQEYEEMARITGAGVSALKMRVKRAREELRRLLTEVDHVRP